MTVANVKYQYWMSHTSSDAWPYAVGSFNTEIARFKTRNDALLFRTANHMTELLAGCLKVLADNHHHVELMDEITQTLKDARGFTTAEGKPPKGETHNVD